VFSQNNLKQHDRIHSPFFPAQEKDDVTVYAALASTLNKIYPETQITKIEEL